MTDWIQVSQQILTKVSKILSLMPKEQDGYLTKGFKFLGLINLAHESYTGVRGDDYLLDKFVKDLDLKSRSSLSTLQLVNILTKSYFAEHVHILNRSASGNLVIYEYRSKYGSIYLSKVLHMAINNRLSLFHESADFDWRGLLDCLWSQYNGVIELQVVHGVVNIEGFSCHDHPLSKAACERLENLSKKYLRSISEGENRSVLFWGPPGVGKSTLALQLGYRMGRVVHMSGTQWASISRSYLNFILDALSPGCIIIEDVDRVGVRNLSDQLSVLEGLCNGNRKLLIIFTANRVSQLDCAFVRPGRIDEVEIFEPPDREERLSILEVYANHYGIDLGVEFALELLDRAEGLGAAWMREIVIQLQHSSPEEVLDRVDKMQALRSEVRYLNEE